MKTVVALLLVFGLNSFGSVLPYPLKPMEGTALISLTEREKFNFEPGETAACEDKVVGSEIWYFCDVRNTQIRVGEKLQFAPTRLRARTYSQQGELYREFLYTGIWSAKQETGTLVSNATLLFWVKKKTPQYIDGRVSLDQLGVSSTLISNVP